METAWLLLLFQDLWSKPSTCNMSTYNCEKSQEVKKKWEPVVSSCMGELRRSLSPMQAFLYSSAGTFIATLGKYCWLGSPREAILIPDSQELRVNNICCFEPLSSVSNLLNSNRKYVHIEDLQKIFGAGRFSGMMEKQSNYPLIQIPYGSGITPRATRSPYSWALL